MGFIDLHVHSTASDGTMNPGELVDYACQKGLFAFALTDHDTVEGIPAAMRVASKRPVKVIPGIELTSSFGEHEIHILGYNVDYEDLDFIRILRYIRNLRQERTEKICSQLRTYGIDITLEEVKTMFPSHTITRAHFALYLVSQGYVSSKAEAFEKYLGEGKPCYIPTDKLSAYDAVNIIYNAGGIPVLAHPVNYKMDDDILFRMMGTLKDLGVNGIEAIYPENTYEDEMKYKHYAEILDMYITGGTDFHGALKPEIDLGTGKGNLMIPQSLLDALNIK